MGLILISAVLLITAIVNLFTKYEATIAGVIFSAVFFTIFTVSEHHVAKERHGKPEQLDQFRVYGNQELGSGAMGVRPGNILVAVRDPRNLYYLRHMLGHTDTLKQDVVVMSARLYHREHSFQRAVQFWRPARFSTTTSRSFLPPPSPSRKKKASRFPCWWFPRPMCSKPSW